MFVAKPNRIWLSILALTAWPVCTVGQTQPYTAAEAKESLASMARPNGAWVTSNAAYWTADSGEPTEYLMRYTLEAGGFVLRGCMWGRSEGRETGRFWTFYHAWDPAARAILAYQISPSGAAAVGHERPLGDGTQEAIQQIMFPGSEPQGLRHVNRLAHPDTLITQSYDGVAGEWMPRRSYAWIWRPDITSNPCRSDQPR